MTEQISTHKMWSDEDIEYLKEHYGEMHTDDVARHLLRTPASVYRKAHLLELTTPSEYIRHEGFVWDSEADDHLRECYAKGMTASEIAKITGRSPASIYRRASTLGINRKSYNVWTDYEIGLVLRLLNEGISVESMVDIFKTDPKCSERSRNALFNQRCKIRKEAYEKP